VRLGLRGSSGYNPHVVSAPVEPRFVLALQRLVVIAVAVARWRGDVAVLEVVVRIVRRMSGSMRWLATTATATLSRPEPQAGNTAAFQAKSSIVSGSSR
jgi:hypothetical protein